MLTCFPWICNLEFPDISFGDLLRFEYITSLFSCLCMSMLTSNSSGNMQKHGYLGRFHAAFARENISWVWVIGSYIFFIIKGTRGGWDLYTHVRNFSHVIFKLDKDIYCPEISDKFDRAGSASLNIRIMDHL